MKYKVTLNGKTYEVEVEQGKAVLLDEYEALAPAPAVPAAPAAAAAPEGRYSSTGRNKQGLSCRYRRSAGRYSIRRLAVWTLLRP